jgi:hypothetical protein
MPTTTTPRPPAHPMGLFLHGVTGHRGLESHLLSALRFLRMTLLHLSGHPTTGSWQAPSPFAPFRTTVWALLVSEFYRESKWRPPGTLWREDGAQMFSGLQLPKGHQDPAATRRC